MKQLNSYVHALKLAGGHQINAQELINGRMYLEDRGWSDIKLKKDFKDIFHNDLTALVGGRKTTVSDMRHNLREGERPQHWALGRVFVYDYSKNSRKAKKYCVGLEYCAGQDYGFELSQLRKKMSA